MRSSRSRMWCVASRARSYPASSWRLVAVATPPRRGPRPRVRTSSMPGAVMAGRASLRPWRPRMPTSWCSWMATAPTARAAGCDFVLVSRARGRREEGSIAWHQLAAGRVAGWGMRLLYGVGYTDMCALRAIRRQALLELAMRELTYGWNLEMQMRAARAGLRILEIPVDYRRRRGGNSKVAGSLTGTMRAGARIIATFARVASETNRWRRGDDRQRELSNVR